MRRKVNKAILEERDNGIVKLVDNGVSVGIVAKLVGVTRERICQIYFKKTGISVKEKRVKERIKQVKGYKLGKCVWCDGPKATRKAKYCSPSCFIEFKSEVQRRVRVRVNYAAAYREEYGKLTKELGEKK